MRTIRASELGVFSFCRLAWWRRLQGVEAENRGEMAAGSAFHAQHARQVWAGRALRLAGWLLLLLSLTALAAWLTGLLLP